MAVAVATAALPSLTISCLVSDDLVPGPGLVRLIFILSPASTVAEWTAAAAAAIFPAAEEVALAAVAAAAVVPPLFSDGGAGGGGGGVAVVTSRLLGEPFGLVPLGIPAACCCCCGLTLLVFFSISASKSMIKLPIPTSHSESSYSKLEVVGLAVPAVELLLFVVVAVVVAVMVTLGAMAQARESGRASSSPVAAASGPDSFIGPAHGGRRQRLRAREPHHRPRQPASNGQNHLRSSLPSTNNSTMPTFG